MPKMSKLSGIERLEANPVTGSVLFIHNIDVNSIFEYARKNNLFDIKKTQTLIQIFIRAYWKPLRVLIAR